MGKQEAIPVVYTDGACLGNPGPGGWGVRILYPDGRICEWGGAAAATTNNRMELQAAIEALRRLGEVPQAVIYTDSRYLLDGLTRWLPQWQRRGWKTKVGTPVKNRELWQALAQLNRPGFSWRYVPGHRGDAHNARVDAIARAFARGKPLPLVCREAGSPAPADQGSRVRYVSLVGGQVAVDDDWPSCAARVRGARGARYKKVHSTEELLAFCRAHGVAPPPDLEG
ncbi:MAG: hypothetical protein KatS3mg131_2211 [Candidatus Tectimicrobiota bacterium]|nr:MAG: hypothetical protein KatS3mg131_2211 [Candidatus Tectomicrobia bacterium]